MITFNAVFQTAASPLKIRKNWYIPVFAKVEKLPVLIGLYEHATGFNSFSCLGGKTTFLNSIGKGLWIKLEKKKSRRKNKFLFNMYTAVQRKMYSRKQNITS